VKIYETKDIRNVGIVGHGHCGKTSVVSGLLFAAGATSRLTRTDEGNIVTDYDEEEIQRKLTISTALAAIEWKKTKINILDTPGFNMFVNDARATLLAADAAIVVMDAISGVEPHIEKMWGIAEEFELPRAIVINKLDGDRETYAANLLEGAVQLPLARAGLFSTRNGRRPQARASASCANAVTLEA
jgi:elongation factor G